MTIRRILATALLALSLAGATGFTVHAMDTRSADRNAVRDYNDGWLDGVCEGNPPLARTAYGMTNCK